MSGYTGALALAPGEILEAVNPADRRAHPRIPSIQLPDTEIRIPHRPGVSLVDLSSGGALLELPFRMHPQSRFTVEIRTAAERLAVPFQLLRCYVADLKGGVRYHAAGAFEEALNLPSASEAGVENRQRLMASLERLLSIHRADQASERFHQLLTLAADGIHRGESAHLVSVKVKAFLTRLYPALAIYPTTATWFDDTLSSAGYFGFTFKAASTLTASDRRFLKLSAQVMVMMDDCRRVEVPDVPVTAPHAPELASPIVVYSAADWLDVRPSATASAAPARIRLQPKTRPAAMPAASRRASRPPDRPRRLASRWLMGLI